MGCHICNVRYLNACKCAPGLPVVCAGSTIFIHCIYVNFVNVDSAVIKVCTLAAPSSSVLEQNSAGFYICDVRHIKTEKWKWLKGTQHLPPKIWLSQN